MRWLDRLLGHDSPSQPPVSISIHLGCRACGWHSEASNSTLQECVKFHYGGIHWDEARHVLVLTCPRCGCKHDAPQIATWEKL